MLKLTFPILKRRFQQYKKELVILGILSLMLGVVPTLKSELESGVIQEINNVVVQSSSVSSPPPAGSVIGVPLQRFRDNRASDQQGVPERLANILFRNVTLGWAVLVYLLIAVIVFAVEFFSKSLQAVVSKDLFAGLRGEGLRRGLLTDPSELPNFNNIAGNYAVAIQQGATNVSTTYGYMLDAGQHIFALVTTIVLVATKSWIFALFAVLLALGQVAISVLQARRLAAKRTELDRTRNDLVGRTDDILSKREIIVAYEQQDDYVKKLDDLTADYAEVDRKLVVAEQKYNGLSQLLSDFGRILILFLALILAVIFGQSAIGNIGDAYFLISIYVRIFVPSSNLLMRYDSLKRSEATSKTFLDVLQAGPSGTSEHDDKDQPRWLQNNDIEFSDVSFRYHPDDRRDVLSHCTFKVPAGKTTLILGPSGSGKTTIARLLLKFWPVHHGSIRIGGRDIHEHSAQEVRAHMSYVSQRDHIIDDTIQDNLSWGASTEGITPERMRQVIRLVEIDPPHGYDDVLEVPARDLSPGQAQRLSIARMMLDESEIVIMDEPLAGVDVFTIRDLLPHLTEVLRERNHTVVMISHRLAFAGCSDHVIVLNIDGQIVEEGSPRDLIKKKGGVFASLHEASVTELSLDEPVVSSST